MSSSDRPKRPSPERTQPIRNWSTLFAVPSAEDAATGPDPGSGAREGPRAGLNDVVSRSVDLGYRVIDEYIRQGQKAAQRINERSYATEAVVGDFQDLAMRMTQYASDFAAVWLEFVELAAFRSGAPNPTAAGGGSGARPASTPAHDNSNSNGAAHADARTPAPSRIRIEVLATQPTEVSLDIHPNAATAPLVIHALRAVDADTPRITDVSFDPGSSEQPSRLRIRLPAGHPAGVYSGLIIDAQTNRPVGSVTVVVAEA